MVLIKLGAGLADFTDVRDLIAIMAAWDAAETRKRGIAAEELLQTYYSHSPASLMAKFTSLGAGMLIAHLDGIPVGCVGFSCVAGRSAEIQKMYVNPQYRGKGIGRVLMAEVLKRMRQAKYHRAELETVSFMTEAIALYISSGFQFCGPLHAVPECLRDITVFMERDL